MAILDHSGRSNVLRLGVLLTGIAWTVPFLQPVHRYPLTAFYSEWLAFALGLAAAAVLLHKEAWREATVPVIAFAPLGLAAVVAAQVALGRLPYAEQGLVAGLYLAWAVLMLVLGHALGRGLALDTIARTLAGFLLVGGVLQAVVGLAQLYPFAGPLDFLVAQWGGAALYGNLGQPNHYAASVTLALVSAAYLYGCGRLAGTLAGACAALFLVVLALAGSRSPWLYLTALAALALLLHRRQRDASSRRLAWFASLLLPGFVVAHGVAPFIQTDLPVTTSAERLFQIASGIAPRLELWSGAWQMFLSAPLLGAGFGQFAWHHFLHQAAGEAPAAPGLFNHAHNVVLQLMAETGALGALVIGGAVLVWLADLRRVRFEPAWWWLLAVLAVIGIHSLLEYPLWYAYFLGPAAFLLGLGAQRRFALRLPGAGRAAVGLALAVGCANLAAVIPPYRDFERLVFSAVPHSSSAPAFAQELMKVHREPLLTPYVELAIAHGVSVDRTQLDDKLELATRALHFAPLEVVAWRQALLLALAGRAHDARERLERSLAVYPAERAAIVAELERLVPHHPSELAPLLELTTSKFADGRASRDAK